MLVISQIAISGRTATGPTNDLYGPELQHGSSWRDGQFGPPMTTGICPPLCSCCMSYCVCGRQVNIPCCLLTVFRLSFPFPTWIIARFHGWQK